MISMLRRRRTQAEARDRGLRLVAASALALLLLGLPEAGRTDTTVIQPTGGSEVDLVAPGGILDQIYGLTNLERVDDFLGTGLVAEDELWVNTGSTSAVAQAKFAGFTNTLGYFEGETGTTFIPLLTVAGQCFGDCTQSASFTTSSALFRFALSSSGGNTWSSRLSDNSDGQADHMVTWQVMRTDDAHPTNPVGAYVIAWEDKPSGSSDNDYNDLVIEISGPTEPARCGDFIVNGDEECDQDDATCCGCRAVDLVGTEGVDTIDIVAEGFPNGAVVHALGGADTIIGSEGPDVICGGTSPDEIFGNGGDDILLGQDGADTITGDAGDDHLLGGGGADDLDGGIGDDVVEGGDSADQLKGGSGDDVLHGDSGADNLDGGPGFDLVVGGEGPDNASGGSEDDAVFGDGSADILDGGPGDDLVIGGVATDQLNGGDGNDVLDGGPGHRDKLFGDGGDDTMEGGSGLLDSCDGGAGVDTAGAGCEKVTNVP